MGIKQKITAYLTFIEVGSIQRWVAAAALGCLYAHFALGLSISILQSIAGFLSIFFVLCNTMTINDYFDIEIDKIKEDYANKMGFTHGARDRLIITKDISKREASACILSLYIAGLALSLLLSIYLSITLILIALLSIAYSAPPLRLKQKYPYSTACELAGAFLPFLAGYSLLGVITLKAVALSLIPWFDTGYSRFRHEAMFGEVDKITGKKTVAVVHGSRRTRLLSHVFLLTSFLATITLFLLSWLPAILLLIFLLYLVLSSGAWLGAIPKLLRSTAGMIWGFLFSVLVLVAIVLWI